MTRRQLAAGAVFTILIVIGIMTGSRHRSLSPARVPQAIQSGARAAPPSPLTAHAIASAAGRSSALNGLWVRPPAMVAARNLRRASLNVTLKPLGANDKLIARLTDGDISTVVTDLKQLAQQGDASAANILDYMAHFTCLFAGVNGEGSAYQASQLLDAQALPAADADWVGTVMHERAAYNKQMSSVCQQSIDAKEADQWVAARAIQGDAASRYLLAMFGSKSAVSRDQQMFDAAAGGYPWAQVWLAGQAIAGYPVKAEGADSLGNAEDLLKAAAADLPIAESQLARCEFTGCPDIPADIPSAVTHAREAAQRGSFESITQIGPQLQASQIDPDEVAAWNLVHASLTQQGCAGFPPNAKVIQSVSYTLNSPATSANARSLAEKYWQDYGTQMLTNLGCGP